MRGAVYRGTRRIELAEVERPPVGGWDVVVKIAGCGVCGSDLHIFEDNEWRQPKVIGGHEFTGEVVEVGAEVAGLAIGDRVAIEAMVRCGRCRFCRSGQHNLCDDGKIIGVQVDGGFADYAVVPDYVCLRLPPGLSNERGVILEPLAVGVRGIRAAGVGWGETVVVLGSGTIGLCGIAAARAAGAGRVITTAKYEHQAALAEEFGATHVVSASDSTANETIMRLLDGKGADAVLETVGGAAPTLQQALRLVRKGGRISLVGIYSGPQTFNAYSLVRREVSLIGAFGYNVSGLRRDFDLAIELAASGRVPVERMITHRYKLSQIQQAFETSSDKSTRAVKVVVEPD